MTTFPLRRTSAPGVAATVPWVRPVFEPDEALLGEIRRALATGRVTNDGPTVREFERQLARYLGVEDCVAVSSGSAALLLSLQGLGIRSGTVILPAFTFVATLNAIVLAGFTPVFCDIDPGTWTLCPRQLARLLQEHPDTRVVVPVNVFGVPPDLPAIATLAARHGAEVLYDNAHGVGTQVAGRRCPPEPAVQTFSLHATKVLPAVEGGAIVAHEPGLLAEVRRRRNHGIGADAGVLAPGFNAKMSELHAAVGLHSLRGLEAALDRRRGYAERLQGAFRDAGEERFVLQEVPATVRTNWQNLGVLCRRGREPDAAAASVAFGQDGIETRRYFQPALHRATAYGHDAQLPVTDHVVESVLCLPLHSRMDATVLDRLVAAIYGAAR